MKTSTDRESLVLPDNPLGLCGIEFVEYHTAKPQALGQTLEMMGFRLAARHRSREVLLYQQGGVNIIVNAHAENLRGAPRVAESTEIAAVAFRVRDAAKAYRRAIGLGAWAVPSKVEVMELNIPAVHGVGSSRIYFVDRYKEFSIYDVDFVRVPEATRQHDALSGLHVFGLVQYIGFDRLEDWKEFYSELFGFTPIPDDHRFGILPKGVVLRSPCGSFYWQLIEPAFDSIEIDKGEELHRLAFGVPDVLTAVRDLQQRGVEFVESPNVHTDVRGALTVPSPHGVTFELVHNTAKDD